MRLKDILAVFGIGVSPLFVTSVQLRATNQRTIRIRTSALCVVRMSFSDLSSQKNALIILILKKRGTGLFIEFATL